MKKIISICAVILSLAIIITVFAACGKKTEDETTTTNPIEDVTSSEPVVTVSENNAMVSYGNGRHQILGYPEGYLDTFDYEYAKEHYDIVDMNFDGVLDVCIAANKKGNDISYYCWLYDSVTNGYVYSEELSAIKNISVDAENKQILSVVYDGDSEKVNAYKWGEKGLELSETFGEGDKEIPTKVTETIKNNSVGTNKKPSTTTKPDKNNKPGNTTTTKKPGNTQTNGVTLVEGDFDAGWY